MMKASSIRLENKERAGIYKGIQEAFTAGKVISKADVYRFKQNQCITRFNTSSRRAKSARYALEYLTGYGVKPVRVLLAMAVWFLITFLLFSVKVGVPDALMLTSGALFTFGAKAQLLDTVGITFRLLYVLTSFVGIALTALFITSWAGKWLRE
jgi:hypothetical protein